MELRKAYMVINEIWEQSLEDQMNEAFRKGFVLDTLNVENKELGGPLFTAVMRHESSLEDIKVLGAKNENGVIVRSMTDRGVRYRTYTDENKNHLFECSLCNEFKDREQLDEYAHGYYAILCCPECVDNYDLPGDV